MEHPHKLKRVMLGDFEVYKCMLPGCSFYLRTELIVGRMCQCWRCGKEVAMTPGMARQAKPHCCKREEYNRSNLRRSA